MWTLSGREAAAALSYLILELNRLADVVWHEYIC